ncbi:hypothetical protein [Chitinophaga barathri]|uniref:hypothetical protein n=1 Tax=Chitinophaga barathri TaxID=1647451 RepID=UPI0013C45838|nr:hypothetical protein [Chitinophaga barathri]
MEDGFFEVRKSQKYRVWAIKTPFSHYIFLGTIMMKATAFSYKIEGFTGFIRQVSDAGRGPVFSFKKRDAGLKNPLFIPARTMTAIPVLHSRCRARRIYPYGMSLPPPFGQTTSATFTKKVYEENNCSHQYDP